MSPFAKGVAAYALQATVAIVVGTIVGTLVGIGIRFLVAGEISSGEVHATINGAIGATATIIVLLTAIGSFPAGAKKP
ncbi:MAG TPA: hypothetical protein VGJ16_11715 [Pirellulales bacterium]|jgi:hypothetical protein